jgi:UDP-N-acetylglucosamine--N-acetylmuramyl-(pentapeptide) pyrophosphoryl-undecaprenol N-acetylglucosamine transferase
VRPGFVAPDHDDVLHEAGRLRLLVLGGSQGARIFSDVLPAAIAAMAPNRRARLTLMQQCRPEDLDRVRASYEKIGFAAELAAFFDDVPRRMAMADLLLCRSGASTVAELLTLHKPSLLIPYPHAADDHQNANAIELERAEAAMRLEQAEATPERLAAILSELMEQPLRLAAMSRAAATIAWEDASERLADAILEGVARPVFASSSASTLPGSHS